MKIYHHIFQKWCDDIRITGLFTFKYSILLIDWLCSQDTPKLKEIEKEILGSSKVSWAQNQCTVYQWISILKIIKRRVHISYVVTPEKFCSDILALSGGSLGRYKMYNDIKFKL